MHLLSSSPLVAFLLLSLFQISVLAGPSIADNGKFQLVTRQQATTSCAEYSMLANYSTIGLNSTYRAAFIQASPQGTDPSTAIVDGATKKFNSLKLKFDTAVNAQCGNLSTLAVVEAEKNFTMGIVGPFTIKKTTNAGVRVGGDGGLGTAALVALVVGAGLWL
ncbi:Uncharacterized protein BP5553_07796 [Venustampulla echinocandica]|uniref:Uncharacterized protein n=1 Tax=Venustampulla echinocandica TaxID=2656787 RepID=A0A370THK4_9HELO|nr:Uncharacterized protein BP5553_07796 [Venustampulla echinocandica]RDL34668.1 Uncharacterized protein BP5553_07796 [Venustampulla echinocandica]